VSSGFSSRPASSPDPVTTWGRRCLALGVGATALLAPTGTWALKTLPPRAWTAPAVPASSAKHPRNDALPAVDRSAFERDLWWTLPAPGAANATAEQATTKPTALPLGLDLVGVTDLGGTLIAALYDRRADRLLLVRHGESVLGAQVLELTRERVTLVHADGELVLTRRRPGP